MSEIHSVGPFILGKSLGSGATGKVKLGFHKDTGFKVAIKIMNKEVLSSRPSMRKKVEREIVVMKLIDHPNVLKLHDVYETSKYLFLVTEYVEGGELFDYLINKGSLEPAEALRFFQQIIRGLDHCHSQRICHRDLKPENLLLDADRNLKIGDFGMAALMRRGALLSTSCGSPHYASPEVVTGKNYSGMTADVWSCGVILYALLTGKLPFDDDDIRKLLGKVKSGAFTMPAFLPAPAQDLIGRMLTVDPAKRITIAQIREHKWFSSNADPLCSFAPISVEDMSAEPLEDAAAIDDEILRSLKVLGLGSDMDIEHSLTSKIPNLTLVFYRLLQDRKEKQTNNNYNAARGNRNRSNTHDTRERSLSEHTRGTCYQEGKARSNSFAQPEGVVQRVLSVNSKQRRPSPLVDAKRGGSSQGLIFPISPSTSSASTTTFSVSDETATIVSISNSTSSELPASPRLSPRTSPPLNSQTSPPTRDKFKKFSQSPPPSPPLNALSGNPSSPISISNKSRVMKLANEGAFSPLGTSPIIGSNPKRSWFSNFFTGSPHSTSFLDDEDSEGPSLTIREPSSAPPPNHQSHQPSHQPAHQPTHQPTHQSHHSHHSHHPSHHHSHHNSHHNHHHNGHHIPNIHHSSRDHSPRDHSPRDHSSRDHSPRDHSSRDHSSRDSPRDHSSRDHSSRDHSRDHSSRDHSLRDYPVRDHPTREYGGHHSHSHHSHHNHHSNSHHTGSHHGPASTRDRDHPPHPPALHPNHTHTTGFQVSEDTATTTAPPSPTNSNTNSNTNNHNYNNKRDTYFSTTPASPRPEHVRASMEMQTGKSGVELGAEIQRTLSALKTSWRLHTNELYTAKYDGTEGSTCQFSVELVDLKTNSLNLISVSHLGGTATFFETLCTQFQAEVKL